MVKTTLLTVTMMLGIVVSAWAVVGGGIDNSINNSSDSDSHSSSWADSDSSSKADSHSSVNSFDNQSQKQDATAIQGQGQAQKSDQANSQTIESAKIPIYNNVPAAEVRPLVGTSSLSVASPWGSATGSIETATGKLTAYGDMIIRSAQSGIDCKQSDRMNVLLDDMKKASKPHKDYLVKAIRFFI